MCAGGLTPVSQWPPSSNAPGLILLHGCPRSGTTWVAKIFDSHPDVLYRHEPDITLPNDELPFLPMQDELDIHADEARNYLDRLIADRSLRTAGSLPIFSKNFCSRWQRSMRRATVYGLHATEKLLGSRWAARLKVPALASPAALAAAIPVIKSVSAMGRTHLYLRAIPDARAIVIVRHPCGFVASMLRGFETGQIGRRLATRDLASTAHARERGLSQSDLDAGTPVEKLAWIWTLLNEAAMVKGPDGTRVKVLRYEDLCTAPERVSRDLFTFGGIAWNAQTERFLRKSTSGSAKASYFSIVQDPLLAANRWRDRLSPEDIATVERIVRRSRPGRMFYPD